MPAGPLVRMEPFLARIRAVLAGLPLPPGNRRFAVAVSGGLDSTVLLTAMARLLPVADLRALHIDHGLYADSAQWERHCRQLAATLGTAYQSVRVAIAGGSGASLEALAREARYRALAQMLECGEVLLTAHHGDDQLETVLLRLLRGSGVRGLRGIIEFAAFGPGFLARPMLDVSRDEIRAQAAEWKLVWIEDPSNADLRFDRNFLRTRLLPEVRARWPAAPRCLVRAARQMADAEEILHAAAAADAAEVEPSGRIARTDITALSAARQRNLLRHLIELRQLPLPSATQLETLRMALAVDRTDARTRVQWPGGEARLYREHLYLQRPLSACSADDYRARLEPDRPWHGPEGRLALERTEVGGLPDVWVREGIELRFRAGGERFRPGAHGPTRRLKRWLQEAHVVPWMRSRIPLLYYRRQLIAVGDLWAHQADEPLGGEAGGWRVRWTDHPPVH